MASHSRILAALKSPNASRVLPRSTSARPRATRGYSGDCVIRHASETFCGAGAGTFMSSACIGLANDSISSIKVGYGTWVYLCRDTQLGG